MPKLSKDTKQGIVEGRLILDAYNDAHIKLHKQSYWTNITSEAHTLLREKMLAELKKQGFSSPDEFLVAEKAEINKK